MCVQLLFCGLEKYGVFCNKSKGVLLLLSTSDEEVAETDVTSIGFPEGTKVTYSGFKYGDSLLLGLILRTGAALSMISSCKNLPSLAARLTFCHA